MPEPYFRFADSESLLNSLVDLYDCSPVNLLNPLIGTACKGDGNDVDGSGTDDGPAIQEQMDRCVQVGKIPVLQAQAGRAYIIRTPLSSPYGVLLESFGGRSGRGLAQPAPFVFDMAGEIGWDIGIDAQNIPMTGFRNICFTGRTDGNNKPATLIRYRGINGAAGLPDTGSFLDHVWLEHCSGDALVIEGGATNFLINHGRFDNWGGYGIRVNGHSNMTIGGQFTFAMGASADGMIFMNGETSGESILKLYGLKLEGSANLNQTYASGASPFDKRGLIRLGVNPSGSVVQHHVHFDGLSLAQGFGIPSHSLFQVTGSGSTDLLCSRKINITGMNGKGLARGNIGGDANANDEIRILGGRVDRRPAFRGTGNYGIFHYGIGEDSNGEQIISEIISSGFYMRDPIIEPRTVSQLLTDFPKEGQRSYVTDSTLAYSSANIGTTVTGGGSNKTPVIRIGSNWIIG